MVVVQLHRHTAHVLRHRYLCDTWRHKRATRGGLRERNVEDEIVTRGGMRTTCGGIRVIRVPWPVSRTMPYVLAPVTRVLTIAQSVTLVLSSYSSWYVMLYPNTVITITNLIYFRVIIAPYGVSSNRNPATAESLQGSGTI